VGIGNWWKGSLRDEDGFIQVPRSLSDVGNRSENLAGRG